MAGPWNKIDRPAARKMRRTGSSLRQIATRFGVSKAAAARACRGVVCPIIHRSPGRPAKGSPAVASAAELGLADHSVPTWVKAAGLTEDFCDFRRDFDIYHAARECRRLKAEAQRPCL